MKRSIAFAIGALLSTTAWAHSGLFQNNIDTFGHVLLDIPEPTWVSESSSMQAPPENTMTARDYYGTSQPEMVTRSIDQTLLSQGHDVVPDLYGHVILDVHPELIPAWSYR